MLSKEEIPWYRPSRWMKSFLSLKVWAPVANLSFSIYLIHLMTLPILSSSITFLKSKEESDWELNPEGKFPDACPVSHLDALLRFFFVLIVSFLANMVLSLLVVYLPFEKPALDARRAFKRK